MDATTHPAAYAYALARCDARRAADRYTKGAALHAVGLRVVNTGATLRKADRAAWQAVRAALGIDLSLTDAGLVLSRAADLLPALTA